jgi:hypothetical protein
MAPWYRQDAFLHPDNAEYDPTQPGNIGGVKPSPQTVAEPPSNAVRETYSTDETIEHRNEEAKKDDSPAPVATDSKMGEEMFETPGRDEDGEHEGEPGFYRPGNHADNLFGPDQAEENEEDE